MRFPQYAPSIPIEAFPANRCIEELKAERLLLVPRAKGATSGISEASLAVVDTVMAYGSDVAPDIARVKGGIVKALTQPYNELAPTYFVGDVNHAGIVPVKYARALTTDTAAQANWRENAYWSADEDWQAYVQLLTGAINRFRKDPPAAGVSFSAKNPARHAPNMASRSRITGRTVCVA